MGAARSASSPAVCVRVHAHVSPAPRPGPGTAPGTVSPTAQLRGLVGRGRAGTRRASAPPPPSSPSCRTGELGYQLRTPTPAPLPARALCGNAPGGFITHCPRRRGAGSPRRGAPSASLGQPCDTVGEGVRRRWGQVVLCQPFGFPSSPPEVPDAGGR